METMNGSTHFCQTTTGNIQQFMTKLCIEQREINYALLTPNFYFHSSKTYKKMHN